MDSLPLIIPPILMDISIKRRKQMDFNVRYQYENPRGDEFKVPEKCKKLHTGKISKLKFQCCNLTKEDVLAFRKVIYQSLEKRDQNNVLRKYIEVVDTKANKSTGVVTRLKQVYYKVPNLKKEELSVCINMFYEATGMGKCRIANLAKKIYKVELLENGGNRLHRLNLFTNLPETKTAKKESLLQLEKGSLQKLTNILNNARANPGAFKKLKASRDDELAEVFPEEDSCEEQQMEFEYDDTVEDFEEDFIETTDVQESSGEGVQKEESECSKFEEFDEEDHLETESFQAEDQMHSLQLDSCRICRKNAEILVPIFEASDFEKFSVADMLDFIFNLKILEEESQSNQICNVCLERLKAAMMLKVDLDEVVGIHQTSREHYEPAHKTETEEAVKSLNITEIIEETVADEIQEMKEESMGEIEVLEEIESFEASKIEAVDETSQQFTVDESSQQFADDTPIIQPSESLEIFKTEIVQIPKNSKDIPDCIVFDPERKKKTRDKVYSDITPRMCFLCPTDFEETPEEHFRIYHNYVGLDNCEKCEFECEFPWLMNLHYQVHEDNWKICENCGKKISLEKGKYTAHKARCGVKDVVHYQCNFCSYTSSRVHDLRIHERKVHTKETPYDCHVCSEAFSSRMLLRRHQMKHGIGATCYCKNCGKGYLQKYELDRHAKKCSKLSKSSDRSIITEDISLNNES